MTDEKNDSSGEFHYLPMIRDEVEPAVMDIMGIFLDEVPSLPVHVHQLLQAVSDIETDIDEVTRIVSADPGIVSKILRIVNSSYYGLAKTTDNLNLAIVLLGFNEIKKIALHSSFSNIFSEGWKYRDYDTADLWEHAYMVSVAAEQLDHQRDARNAGTLLTLGLLHDLGKFALFKLAVLMKRKGIKPLSDRPVGDETNLIAREESLFGVNHAVVGGMLAEKWNLPERICTVLEYHHHPSFQAPDKVPAEFRVDITTVSLADWNVHRIAGHTQYIPPPAGEFLVEAGFPDSPVDVVTDDFRERIENARRFVGYLK